MTSGDEAERSDWCPDDVLETLMTFDTEAANSRRGDDEPDDDDEEDVPPVLLELVRPKTVQHATACSTRITVSLGAFRLRAKPLPPSGTAPSQVG